MKKQLMALCAAFVCTASSINAQMAHYYIGSGRNEVARSVKVLQDGSSVIAGYIYDFDKNKNLVNADNLLLRVAPDGTILWQKQWGTQNNDFLYEMIVTQNQDVVVVGTAGRGGVFQNNTAAVYRFDNNGNMLNEAFVRDPNGNGAGEVFNGVCETANGDIVAVGVHDFAPGSADAFLSFFTPALGHIYNEKIPLNASQSDVFNNVVSDGNLVYVLGYTYDGPYSTTYYDQVLLEFDPYSGPLGNINWMNAYEISYNAGNDSIPIIMNSDFPAKVFVQGQRLLVTGYDGDGFNIAQGERQYIFRCYKNGGFNPEVRIVNNGSPAASYCNASMIVPITDDEMFISNAPINSYYDYDQIGIVGWVNVFASHMSSFSSSTISNSTHFNFYGNESVQGLDINNTGGNLNGYLYMAGNAHNWGKQDNDIFYSVVNPSLRDTTITCPVDTLTYLDTTASEPIAFIVVTDTFETLEPLTDSFVNINLVTTVICGDSNLHNKPSATTVRKDKLSMGSLTVAPNPSNGTINAMYGITDSHRYAELVVTDISGRVLVRTSQLSGNTGIVRLQLPNSVPAGMVVCSLIIDGEVQENDKVLIIK